jgi:transcriptional regulator with XRE-family HTH domain
MAAKRRARPSKPPAKPAAYRHLADYLARSGDTQQELARRVGTTQAYISKLARGGAVPRPMLATRIAEYCHIPLDSFVRVRLARKLEGNGIPA